ncbi:hypothetical protein SO694_00168024, partial [Aureococcus anophagefferens]
MGGSTERRQARPRAASQKPPEPSGDDAAAGESSDGAARRRAPLKRPARPFVSSGSDAAAQSLGANGGTCLDELQSLGAAKISRLMAYGIDTVEALAKVDVKDYPMVSLITGNKRPDRASTTIAKWRDIAQTFLRDTLAGSASSKSAAAKASAKRATEVGELAVRDRDRVRVSEGKHAGRCGVVVGRNEHWTKVQLDGDAAIVSVRKSQVALVGAGDGAAPSAIAAQPLFRLRGGNWSAEEIAYGKCVLQLVEAGRLPGCADNVSRRECLEYALGRDRDCISHRPWYSSGREFRRVGPCSGAALGHLVELRDAFYQTLCPDERAALWAAADKGGATFVFKGAVELKAADKAEGDAAAKAKADAAAKAKAEAAAKEQTRLEKLLKRADRAAAD